MARLRPYPVLALAAWSLFLWTSRLGLAWQNEPTVGRKVLATVPVALFVALGVATVVVLVRRGPAGASEPLEGRGRALAVAFAVWTIGYWVVRMPIIAVDPHGIGFKLVHAVLAVISVGVSIAALRSLRPGPVATAPVAERQMSPN